MNQITPKSWSTGTITREELLRIRNETAKKVTKPKQKAGKRSGRRHV